MDLSIDEKVRYYWMSHDIHTLMIHENYINNTLTSKDEVTRLENISYSADSLSDADLLDSVFDFQLSNYVAINTIKATTKCNKKSMIKFPQYLGKISTMNKNKKSKLDYNTVDFLGNKKNNSKCVTEKDSTESKKKKTGSAVKKKPTKK